MKHKFFYTHLIQITDVTIRLSELDLTEDQKNHLLSLMEANIHSAVIDTVLSELSKEDKKIFLQNLVSDNHERIWEHLKSRIGKAEDKIAKVVKELEEDLIKDMLEAQKLSEENNS
jgi:Mg/Co/Ni transporter MgtE